MQQGKRWKRKIQGNHELKSAINYLRNFVEKEIPAIPLHQYPDRPTKQINLSIGDPTTSLEFRTHPNNLQLIASNVGKVDGYTDFQGLLSARQAIADKFKTKSHTLSADDVYMASGGSMAIWSVMNLLGNKGDNFLFPSPGFPLAITIAHSMGLQPRLYHLQADNNWQANVEQIQKLIDEKTKFILVNDPSNPLGSVWSAAHKRQILALCARRGLPILADEIYEQMSYEDQVPTFAELVEPGEVDKITIFKCSGLTKRYLGPGWRMGWVVVYAGVETQKLIRSSLRGIFNVILMPNTIMQASVPAILSNPVNQVRMQQCMKMMRVNQQTLRAGLQGEHYCAFGNSSGALYATIILHMQHLDVKDEKSFTKLLFAQENVMIFPGVFFVGKVPFVRLVISCSVQKIEEFLLRFKRFCRRHLAKSD